MSDVIVFAGTTEGRELSQRLSLSGIKVHECVATGYGGSLIEGNGNLTVSSGGLGDEGTLDLFRNDGAKVVVDATHPYAVAISRRIRRMCSETGLEYIRLARPASSCRGIRTVPDMDAAVEFLKGTEGNILVTTGSKELSKFTSIHNYAERVIARVLSLPDVVMRCSELGFRGRNLICMQGPFNEDVNYGTMRQFDIRYMVTKDSGTAGGFEEKMRAAERAGVEVVIVGRPEDEGETYDNVLRRLSERFGVPACPQKRNIWVIGIGMGYPGGMTSEAAEACRKADLIIGPERVTAHVGAGRRVHNEFRPGPVREYIERHPQYRDVAVVFSGDIGFHSGARRFLEVADPEWNIIPLCGISSVVYLCSKLRMPWQDVRLVSAHGKDANIAGEVRRNGKTFALLTSGRDVGELCGRLVRYGMDDIRIFVGERLGYPDERIVCGTPSELGGREYDDLSVLLALNGSPDTACPLGIPDGEFVRGDVPMTKSEVRTLAVSKLKLSEDSVAYDIGAGTGSVSVEMARVAVAGKVFAIEAEEDALELIRKNKERFGTDNLEIIGGAAPESMRDLPVPTHAFIGGSGGDLRDIMAMLKEKNPGISIVINSVTLETTCEALECIRDLGLEEIETVCVSVSRSRTTERVHMMVAQNPVYIISCRGAV